jgi:nitrate/TMAO reductase-like tetraheme cytochrome c subunit
MFKSKTKIVTTAENSNTPKKTNWLKISIGVNIAVAAIAVFIAAGSYVGHLSNTAPQFCGLCHIMQTNVDSYMTSSNLDHVHQQAGVQCKDCHDYPLSAEITSGVKFIFGDYDVNQSGLLLQRKYDDKLCYRCHISADHVANLTDFLPRNPHNNHNKDLTCGTCHISHGQQIDYCSSCHENGGQRMTGQAVQPRGTISGN